MGEPDAEVQKLLTGLLPEHLARGYAELRAEGARETNPAAPAPLDQELIAHGLAYLRAHRARPVLMAAKPLSALTGTLAAVEHDLTARHQKLIGGYRVLADLHRREVTAEAGESPADMVRVLSDPEEINGLSGTLINHARVDYMTIDTVNFEVSPTEATINPAPAPVIERGVRCRGLYDAEYLTRPIGELAIRRCVEAGEQARTMPRLPMKMIMADQELALVALTPSGSGGALLVRSLVLLAALRQYFEVLWAQATPVVDDDHGPLGAKERAVLALMAHGLKDDAIARRLDLSVRTVRRSVSSILEHLNVTTRFAAGAAAQRQGLLE